MLYCCIFTYLHLKNQEMPYFHTTVFKWNVWTSQILNRPLHAGPQACQSVKRLKATQSKYWDSLIPHSGCMEGKIWSSDSNPMAPAKFIIHRFNTRISKTISDSLKLPRLCILWRFCNYQNCFKSILSFIYLILLELFEFITFWKTARLYLQQ